MTRGLRGCAWTAALALVAATLLAGPPLAAQSNSYGSGCAGLRNPPLLWHSGTAVPGGQSTLNLSGAPPNALILLLIGTSNSFGFGQPLPWELVGYSGIGPGCSVLNSGEIMLFLNANGLGQFQLGFKNPASFGTDLYFQALVAEAHDPLVMSFTAGVHLHLDQSFTAVPSALDLGSVTVGELGAPVPLEVRNDGPVTLVLDDALLFNDQAVDFDVSFTAPTPVSLPPGASTVLNVEFHPTATGLRQATLRLVQNGLPPGFPATDVPLSGIGLGPLGAEVLLNAGGAGHYGSGGVMWSADFGFSGGSSVSITDPISGTNDEALYQHFRLGPAFAYAFEVPDGVYAVTLHFVEPDGLDAGARSFAVELGGQIVAGNVDPAALWGQLTAGSLSFETSVTGGLLELGLSAPSGNALLCALEVRRLVPVLDVSPTAHDFGFVPSGQIVSIDLILENTGTTAGEITSIGFLIGTGGGAGHEFELALAGQTYTGEENSVTLPVSIPLPTGRPVVAQLSFAPSEHTANDIVLRFEGDFEPVEIPLLGAGGDAGHPFLHVVIETEPVVVDHDSDGSADVALNGEQSHTHEPGHVLTAFTWTKGVELLGNTPQITATLPLGDHHITLQIADDNEPPGTLSGGTDVRVVPVTAVPGVLALHHAVADPVAALDAPLPAANFAEIVPGFALNGSLTVGGSPFPGNDLVVLRGSFTLATASMAQFTLTGGSATRLSVNGVPWVGPAALGAGSHGLEARFAVVDAIEQPLAVLLALDGGAAAPIDPALVVHDQSVQPPVLNAMTAEGSTLGGNEIIIEGFGFFPADALTLHWGNQQIGQAGLLELKPDRIRLLAPAHAAGAIQVTVQTPQGTSNALTFTYLANGAPPVQFQAKLPTLTISKPTCAAWGPDGKLYVATINGRIWAITYDDDYNIVSTVNHVALAPLDNDDILGIAFNPYDPPSPVRVYVAHSEIYAWGGGSFSGPAPFRGRVSILEGPDFNVITPLITGLPNSNHDHGVNGLAFDNNGDLLISIGGNTNAGITWPSMGDLPESPFSGAILKAWTSRPDFDGTVTYLDPGQGNQPADDQVLGHTLNLAPGLMVELQATGLRNAYGIVYTTKKRLYTTDNGPNNGFGPASTGPATQSSDPSTPDELLFIERGNYYGHPNRNRGRHDPRENIYRNLTVPSIPGEFTQTMLQIGAGTGGIDEYRSKTFAGQMRGQLLIQRWNSQPRRVGLAADGRSVTSNILFTPNISSLDIVAGPGGAILGIDYTSDEVHVLLPNDVSATSLTVYDITPWRAPSTGGQPFVIGGRHFGNLGNTTVTIDGLQAALTSVSATRIRGTIPAQPAPSTSLRDVLVTSGAASDTLIAGFRYLPPGPGLEPGTWEVGPAMPVPLSEVASAVVDGVLYVLGGGTFKTYALDIATGVWSVRPNRPFPGDHHSLEVSGRKLYVIGGSLNGSEGQVQIFDTQTNQWSLGTPLPWAGGSVQTCLIGNRIYAAGGFTASGTVDLLAEYDPGANTWTPLQSMPFQQGRNHAAAGTDGQRFFIFGGRGFGSGNTNVVANGFNTVQIYDPGTDTWSTSLDPGSTLAPLPLARGGTGKAVWSGGRFYVMGGETLNGPGANPLKTYDRVDVYDPVTNTWKLEAPMPTARHGIFPVLYQGRLFVAGGGPQAGLSQSAFLEIFTRQ